MRPFKILKNYQGPLKRVKNMFPRYVTFLTFLAKVPFLDPHSSPNYMTTKTIFTRSLLEVVHHANTKLQRRRYNIDCTAMAYWLLLTPAIDMCKNSYGSRTVRPLEGAKLVT